MALAAVSVSLGLEVEGEDGILAIDGVSLRVPLGQVLDVSWVPMGMFGQALQNLRVAALLDGRDPLKIGDLQTVAASRTFSVIP